MKILYVDDDPSFLEQSKTFLEKINDDMKVETVTSAADALKKLEKDNYAAVVSDYQMPGMDGLELLKELRIWMGNDIPFIMFTGKGREEVAMKALNFGADRYLQKGGDPQSQYHVLYQALEQEIEHWHTKNKLQSTEKKYMDLAEKSLVGIYVIQDDVFRYVNPEFCKIFGYERDGLIDRNYLELVHSEDEDRVKEGVEERESGEGEAKRYNFYAETASGEKIYVRVFSVPSTYQGRPAVQGTLIDITEQRSAKKELEEKNQRLSALLENLPGMAYICKIDKHGMMKYVSEGSFDLTGYEPDELINNDKVAYNELIHPYDRKRIRDKVQDAVKRNESFQIKYNIETSSGRIKEVWEKARVIDYEDEKALEGIILDITDIRES